MIFAQIRGLCYVPRWAGLPQSHPESTAEHSFNVAILTHALALIAKHVFEDPVVDVERSVLRALYHDYAECYLGDIPHPVKYATPILRHEINKIEAAAWQRGIAETPPALADHLTLVDPGEADALVHTADLLDAYLKATSEVAFGNHAFGTVQRSLESRLQSAARPEVAYLLDHWPVLDGASWQST